jgi:hypothetical protein
MNIQNLYDVLYAAAAVTGITGTYTLVILGAGRFLRHTSHRVPRAAATPTQPSTQPSDTRELVLR